MNNLFWLPVPDYEGYYEVSNTGVVRGINREVLLPNGTTRCIKGRILKERLNNCGYLSVRLNRNNETHTCFIQRLVADAFLSNPDNLPQVNHISGDKTNNNTNNLEWTNASGNALHAYEMGLNNNCGGSHAFAVGVIDNMTGQRFATIREFADFYHVNYNTARNALNGYSPFPKVIDLTKHSFKKVQRR